MNLFSILLELKLTTLKNAFNQLRKRSALELLTLIIFFGIAGSGLFYFFFQSFRFFRGQEPFGPILITETFYLFNFTLFMMLLISSGVSAYVSLFQSKEVSFLAVKPVSWPDIFFIKLIESLWFSSWSVFFITIPFMAAYGLNQNISPLFFSLYCYAFYIPLVLLAVMLGNLSATLLSWLLPGKKHRRFALILVVLLVTWFFSQKSPGFIKEQGSLEGVMMGSLPHIAFAKNPLLPSYWLSKGILSAIIPGKAGWNFQDSLFYFTVLFSNTLFLFVPLFLVSRGLYPAAYLKAQDFGDSDSSRRAVFGKFFEKIFDHIPWPSKPAMAFLEKDLKTFARNPAEWSQLIIFFGLLLFYFANLRNLHFHILQDIWKQLVFALNTIGTYIVLSSFSMRVIFPMLSLEGSRSWVIGSTPIRFSSVLLEKFLLGMITSLLLTLPLVYLSGWMLEISKPMLWLTLGLGLFVCIALTGLSVGLGAKFINFKTTNPSAIISGFGGSMLLVMHLAYLTGVGIFLVVSKEPKMVTFAIMAAGSLLAGFVPLLIGKKAMQGMEF